MPYVVNTSSSDSRSVSKDFDPEITMDFVRQLGALPITAEARAAIPKKLRVGKPRSGGMPHILGWFGGPWIVSPRVHDIIEKLEPGVQEFSPIELISSDGKRSFGTYFLILPPPQLDALIKEKTEFDSSSKLKPRGVCVLDSRAIRGHHFWRAERPLNLTYFCSDELGDRLKVEKLDGWDLRHRCAVQQKIDSRAGLR
jgi:hypothetical protein